MKKGFTLIELLAVIVILAIILLIAVPQVLDVIDDSKLGTFDSDSKLVLKGVEQLAVKDNYDVSLVNENNIDTLLDIDSNNYLNVIVSEKNNSLYLTKIGTGNWDGYVSYGTYGNMTTEKMPEGLVGYWPLDGDAKDYSINGNNGVVAGATLMEGINNIENTAYSFDGSDSINVGNDSTLNPDTALTISTWIKLNVPIQDQYSTYPQIIGKRETYIQRAYFLSFFKDNLRLYWEIKDESGVYYTLYSSKSDWEINKWYFLTVTFDGEVDINNSKIYINGILDSSTTWNIDYVPQTSSDSKIGGGTYYFEGIIDEMRLYDRALTEEEILLLYNIYNY